MIHSMTGFAAATRELTWGAVSVELRSVNHRYLDVSFRIPDELRTIEQALREAISGAISRGKIECRISYAMRSGTQGSAELDPTLLAQVLALNARARAALPEAHPLGVADILRWPGMLGADALPIDEFRATAGELMRTALGDFTAARAREGAKLAAIILERAAQ